MAIQNEMNRFVDDLVRSRGDMQRDSSLWPAADVCETDREYQIQVELPGIDMNDVKVRVTEDVLTIHGEKKQQVEEGKGEWKSVERSYGTFERSFRFPMPVQSDKVKAKYQHGVLTVTVPKAEQVQPREIQIEG
jgi:HSP20 family protein